MCLDCEWLFGKWETQFANEIFHPLSKKNSYKFYYSEYFLKFCVSISWRVLSYLIEKESFCKVQIKHKNECELFLEKTRKFLLGELENPGKYQQHVILLDTVDSHSVIDMPTNINRYFLRNIELDLPCSENDCYVFTKLPYMVIFGHVCNPSKKNWNNTKINLKKGVIGGKDFTIPGNLYEFILDKADDSRNIENEISEKQKKKIHEDWNNNNDKVKKSETYKALNADIRLFGNRAYD